MANREPDGEHGYYFITITANEEGNPVWSAQSSWNGFEDKELEN
ncbi:MAG: hypothetical protein ABIR84_13825 [Candidatus Nitrotoga sp.]